jgi:hypothetical protein
LYFAITFTFWQKQLAPTTINFPLCRRSAGRPRSLSIRFFEFRKQPNMEFHPKLNLGGDDVTPFSVH